MQQASRLFERNGPLRATKVGLGADNVDQEWGLLILIAVSRPGTLILLELIEPYSDIVKRGCVSDVVAENSSVGAAIIHRGLIDTDRTVLGE